MTQDNHSPALLHNLDDALLQADTLEPFLGEAARQGLLSEAALRSISTGLAALLIRQASRFTGGDSTSIPIRRAQLLTESISYTLLTALRSAGSADQALEILLSTPLEDLFLQGQRRLNLFSKQTHVLYESVRRTRLHTECLAYNNTLAGIAPFFVSYDIDFAAQDCPVSIDYPMSEPVGGVGVSYLNRYLRCWLLENTFCLHFSEGAIQHTLSVTIPGYTQLLENLFEPILLTALCCILCNAFPRALLLDESQRRSLQDSLQGISMEALQSRFFAALDKLFAHLFLTSSELKEYCRQTLLRRLPYLHHVYCK